MRLSYFSLIFLVLILSLFACQTSEKKPSEPAAATTNVQLNPCLPLDSSLLYLRAELKNYTYTGGQLMLRPTNWRAGGRTQKVASRSALQHTKKGNHLHVCLDGETHHISNENNFDFAIPDGKHKLVVFLSREYFESVKVPATILAKQITVQKGELSRSTNLLQPEIIYHAPLGTVELEANKGVLFDFVLVNSSIGKGGNVVRVTINEGQQFTIDTWQAYRLTGLSEGQHQIRLELLNAAGQQIAAPAEGSFVVVAAP